VSGEPQARGPLTEREALIYRLRVVNRLTVAEIGRRLDPPISQQRVSEILATIRSKIPPPDIAALRQESFELFGDIKRRAYELAEMAGAPVTAGKDGEMVFDPKTGEVVRDYAGRVAALRLALDADKEMRKLHGLDAAQKTESTATVRYEVAGLDPDQLR
jgi:hypothetical protein